jgi:hypothetical protein
VGLHPGLWQPTHQHGLPAGRAGRLPRRRTGPAQGHDPVQPGGRIDHTAMVEFDGFRHIIDSWAVSTCLYLLPHTDGA